MSYPPQGYQTQGYRKELIERLTYAPDYKDTGGLGTKTTTATVEASGVVNKDYSSAATIDAPTDARIVVKNIAARLAVTIDSMTAGHLHCRVYVDAQDADHLLFDEDWTTTGAKLDAVNTRVGLKEIIFNLLKDGAAHTFYFFFWVDAGNAVISLVELWEAVGACGTAFVEVLELIHSGFISVRSQVYREGSGTQTLQLKPAYYEGQYAYLDSIADIAGKGFINSYLAHSGILFAMRSTVDTDLTYFWYGIHFVLRSEK